MCLAQSKPIEALICSEGLRVVSTGNNICAVTAVTLRI